MIHYVSLYDRNTGITHFASKIGECMQCDSMLIEGFLSALSTVTKNIFSNEDKIDLVKIGDIKIEHIAISNAFHLDLILIHDEFQQDLQPLIFKIKKIILSSYPLFKKELNWKISELDFLKNMVLKEVTKFNTKYQKNLVH